MAYLAVLDSMRAAALALITKLYYFSKPPCTNTLVKTINLALNGSGLRSETGAPHFQQYRR